MALFANMPLNHLTNEKDLKTCQAVHTNKYDEYFFQQLSQLARMRLDYLTDLKGGRLAQKCRLSRLQQDK